MPIDHVLLFDANGNATFLGNLTTTMTTGAVVAGSNGVLSSKAGTNGQFLIASTEGTPAFATVTSSGGTITYSGGSNTMNLEVANTTAPTTWTPVLRFGGATTGITYATQTGSFTRFGNLAVFTLSIVLTNNGSASGVATIAGLPVSSVNTYPVAVRSGNITFIGLGATFSASLTGNIISLEWIQTGLGVVGASSLLFANNTSIQASGVFIVNN